MPYTVALPAFHGPLDLLLYLVKRNEVDVLDIPIATIAEQFQLYLQVMQALDVELAGDFLVMAATLMEIKSRMLLPAGGEADAEEDTDPRRELVKQLLLPGRTMKDAVAGEVRRQFQLCSENGLDPRTLSHVDSHQHVHVLAQGLGGQSQNPNV